MVAKPEIQFVDKIDIGKPGRPRYRTAVGPDGKNVRIRILDPNAPTFTAFFLSRQRQARTSRKQSAGVGRQVIAFKGN